MTITIHPSPPADTPPHLLKMQVRTCFRQASVIMDTGLLNLLNENPPIDVNVPSIFDAWLHATLSAMVDFTMA